MSSAANRIPLRIRGHIEGERVMRTRRARRTSDSRIPLTIALDPEMLAFIERCAETRRFRSVDAFFDSALSVFRRHVEAMDAYIELQEASGHSFEEIVSSTECEIVVTRRPLAAQKR